MQAMVLTLLMVAGAEGDSGGLAATTEFVDQGETQTTESEHTCDECSSGSKRRWGIGLIGHRNQGGGGQSGWFGIRIPDHWAMPQSCYNPSYGCSPGNNRDIHRYPAFHGTYYRRPYNYRNYFDYPWHADLHEPTSLFSKNVAEEDRQGSTGEESLPLPPSQAGGSDQSRGYSAAGRATPRSITSSRPLRLARPDAALREVPRSTDSHATGQRYRSIKTLRR